jgi:hypothetical protein
MELTGTGGIPQPIEGYKLVIKDVEYFISPNKNVWVNKDFDRVRFGNDTLLSGLTYQLIPILNSGVWISGKMPVPKPQEGILLLCMYTNFYITFEAKNNKWKCKENLSGHHEITHYNTPLAWLWISAPK